MDYVTEEMKVVYKHSSKASSDLSFMMLTFYTLSHCFIFCISLRCCKSNPATKQPEISLFNVWTDWLRHTQLLQVCVQTLQGSRASIKTLTWNISPCFPSVSLLLDYQQQETKTCLQYLSALCHTTCRSPSCQCRNLCTGSNRWSSAVM